jgi:metallo-beta-lactamase class B
MERAKTPHFTKNTISDMEDMTQFTHALIFDDLLIVAQKETNCFVWKTERGLVVIDAIWPAREAFDAIIDAIRDVAWRPEELTALLLTHGHVDHTGCGRWFVEQYQVETILSCTDDDFWREHPTKPDRPETWKDYEITHYVKDGDVLHFRDKDVLVYETPGHTPGCLSYIFPVTESGERHMAALFGGMTPPWDRAGTETYLRSLDYFLRVTAARKVDVALCNHTAIDNGRERIAYSASRPAYLPNIYILGQEGFRNFCEVFRTMSLERLAQF